MPSTLFFLQSFFPCSQFMMFAPAPPIDLARSIIQLTTFASDIICRSREIYRSEEGVVVQQSELETISRNLQELASNVSRSGGILNTGRYGGPDDEYGPQLHELCQGCERVSSELLEAIHDLRLKGEHKRWKSFRQALKSIRSEVIINELAKRLDRYRCQLDTILLFSVR
jgi:hypothetical protein